jgi:hypothetical protein
VPAATVGETNRRAPAQALRSARPATRIGLAAPSLAAPALPPGSRVSFHWIVAGQLAQATRDHELLAVIDELHRETLTQIKWLETQVKQSSPQALVVGSGS